MNYRTLVALLLGVMSISAHAEQRWFEVELLLFQRNVDIKDITEHLSSKEITVNTDNSINFLETIRRSDCVLGSTCSSKANPTVITSSLFNEDANEFQLLEPDALQLSEQRQMLKNHASFDPVLHMVWRMPVESGRTAKPIHLFAGKNLAKNTPPPVVDNSQLDSNETTSEYVPDPLTFNESPETIQDLSPEVTPQIINIDPDKWAIDGNFKVYLDHYLYIDSQLIIRKEVTEQIAQVDTVVDVFDDENGVQIAKQTDNYLAPEIKQQTVIKEILFDQNRRLRSEEIHYLDHPLMGIIVQIRKIPEDELTSNAQPINIVND